MQVYLYLRICIISWINSLNTNVSCFLFWLYLLVQKNVYLYHDAIPKGNRCSFFFWLQYSLWDKIACKSDRE